MAAWPLMRRIGISWIAVELTAAVIAAGVVVALLPAVLILLSRPALPWMALATVLPVSVPLGAILTVWALRLPSELLREAARVP